MSSIFDEYQDGAKRARGRHKAKFWRYHDQEHYICPRCGRGADEVEQFEVHHVDEDPYNGDMDNLRGLCRRCHHEVHGREPPKSLDDWKEQFLELGACNR